MVGAWLRGVDAYEEVSQHAEQDENCASRKLRTSFSVVATIPFHTRIMVAKTLMHACALTPDFVAAAYPEV